MVVRAGLLLLRLASGPFGSVRDELIRNGLTSRVLAIASAIAVTVFGYAIGCRVDVLRRLATADPLTDLLNRRAMENTSRARWERARRYGLPLSVLMIDLDGFSGSTIPGGHAAGDRVLRQPPWRFVGALRGSDYQEHAGEGTSS